MGEEGEWQFPKGGFLGADTDDRAEGYVSETGGRGREGKRVHAHETYTHTELVRVQQPSRGGGGGRKERKCYCPLLAVVV